MPPQNYVQQLASALGFNPKTNNGKTSTNSIPSSTDFESLIEMNRRQQTSVSFINVWNSVEGFNFSEVERKFESFIVRKAWTLTIFTNVSHCLSLKTVIYSGKNWKCPDLDFYI